MKTSKMNTKSYRKKQKTAILKKEMATSITTTAKILEYLNNGKKGPWLQIKGTFMLSSVAVTGLNQTSILPNGVVLTLFINSQTSEIRVFLTKVIGDIPEAANLS